MCLVHLGARRISLLCLIMESLWDFDCDVSTTILNDSILRDSLHQAMRSIVYVLLFVARWFTAIGTYVQN